MAVFLSSFLPDPDPHCKMQAVGKGFGKQTNKEVEASPFRLTEAADIKKIFKKRKDFSHKGTYGHALIIAGAPQTMGAALLSSKGCLYGGAGLTTTSIPESGLSALNTQLPEVMYLKRKMLQNESIFSKYNAIAIGPGLGTGTKAAQLLAHIITLKRNLVADADALNILASHTNLLPKIEKRTILTPHVKEFDNLFGSHVNWWERLQTARKKAKAHEIVIVLKNQYTFVISQQGDVFINPTGNPAMAQGGMGDVLTGLITAYMAQGYAPRDAAIIGCYFHGKAADDLELTNFNVTASQVAEQVPKTIKDFLA